APVRPGVRGVASGGACPPREKTAGGSPAAPPPPPPLTSTPRDPPGAPPRRCSCSSRGPSPAPHCPCTASPPSPRRPSATPLLPRPGGRRRPRLPGRRAGRRPLAVRRACPHLVRRRRRGRFMGAGRADRARRGVRGDAAVLAGHRPAHPDGHHHRLHPPAPP